MRLSQDDRLVLSHALGELALGRDRRFEDMLWLGFADAWRPVLAALVRENLVEMGGREKDVPSITPLGREAIDRLAGGSRAGMGDSSIAGVAAVSKVG